MTRSKLYVMTPYERGQKAFHAGCDKIEGNPYGCLPHSQQWEDGWLEEMYKEKAKESA